MNAAQVTQYRRPGESRDPPFSNSGPDEWVPAFAGTTIPDKPEPGNTCKRRSAEQALALLVDDLLGFGDREGDRLLMARMRLGADKPVLLDLAPDLLLDDAGSLIRALAAERRRANAIAVVFDRILLGVDRDAAEQPGKQRSQHGGHGFTPDRRRH